MPDDVLKAMSVTGYGPVILHDAGDGRFTATAGTRHVTVTGGTQALRFESSVAVSWPPSIGSDRGHDPIGAALEELAHIHRPDLVTIERGQQGDLVVTMWISAEGATPSAVANAVYSTARIATLALGTVTDLVAMFSAADRDEAEAASYQAGYEEAEPSPLH
jgi:hypothetical protein